MPRKPHPPCPCPTTKKCRGGIIVTNHPKGYDSLIFCINKKRLNGFNITEDNQIDITLAVEQGAELDTSEFGVFDEIDLDRYKEVDRANIVACIVEANRKAVKRGKQEFMVRLELKT